MIIEKIIEIVPELLDGTDVTSMGKDIIENSDKSWLEKFVERGEYHAPNKNVKDALVGKAIKIVFIKVAGVSYWIALFAGVAGIILYVAGWKKAGKVVPISTVAYALIKAIESAI